MNPKKILSVQKIHNNNVEKAVFDALNSINAESIMTKKDMKILLKPNVLMPKHPNRAVTTHPSVIQAVIHWVKQFSPSKIYVGDSSGVEKKDDEESTVKALNISGIKEVCAKEGVECIAFDKTKKETYAISNPLILNEIVSTNILNEVDLIINIPKIKTHVGTTLT